jgi:hypothetical protein
MGSCYRQCSLHAGFWGGLVPENVANLTVMDELLNAGALGLKVIKNYLQK